MSALSEPRGDRAQAERPQTHRPASRQDLGALARHLSAEQSKAQASVEARLSEIEAALNRVEGCLFVELQPLLGDAVADGLGRLPTRRRRIGPAALMLLAGLFLGAAFGDEIAGLGMAGESGIPALFVPEGEQPELIQFD